MGFLAKMFSRNGRKFSGGLCSDVNENDAAVLEPKADPPKPPQPQPEAKKTLFERIGGDGAIFVATDMLYDRLYSDPAISHWFEGVSKHVQARKLAGFVKFAMGGPVDWSGNNLTDAHAHMVKKGLADADFDAVVGHFGAVLQELSVPSELISEAAALVESTRDAVLGRNGEAPKEEGPKTLFERIGGDGAIDATTDMLYERLYANDSISHWFEGVPKQVQARKLAGFVKFAMGGPVAWDGKDLTAAHAHMVKKGLADADFDAVVFHLGEVLMELQVPSELIAEAAALVESTRDAVLGRTGADEEPKAEEKKEEEPKTLFERIGGDGAIDATTDMLYERLYADDSISHWFEGVPKQVQARKLAGFVKFAMGGPVAWTGKDLTEAHAHMVKKGLADTDFDAVLGHLGAVLTELKVPSELIAEAAALVESTRDAVLGRTGAAEKPQEEEPKAEEKKEEEPKTLFERIGGDGAIDATTDMLYERLYADDSVSHWFEGVPKQVQARKLAGFVKFAMGGPVAWTGKDLTEAHAHMVKKGLADTDFDAVLGHLGAVLTELKVPSELIAEAAALVESTRDAVLGRTGSGEGPKDEQREEPKGEESEDKDPTTLFARIGGDGAVDAAVHMLYDRLYTDLSISHWFDGVPRQVQARKLAGFVKFAMGGPTAWTGKDLTAAHAHMVKQGLADADFDAVLGHFGAVLTELNVPSDLIAEAAALVESTRDAVLGRA